MAEYTAQTHSYSTHTEEERAVLNYDAATAFNTLETAVAAKQYKMVVVGGNGNGVADIDLGGPSDDYYGFHVQRAITITNVTSVITEPLAGAGASAAIPLLKTGSTLLATGPTFVNADADASGTSEAWTINQGDASATSVIHVHSGVTSQFSTGQMIVIVEYV